MLRVGDRPTGRYQSLEVGGIEGDHDPNAVRQKFGFTIPVPVQVAMLLFFVGMLAVAGYISFAIAGTDNGCLGKPYLYITHHDSHTVLKFTRDGCALSPNILWYGTSARSNGPIPSSFRGISIHPFNGVKDALYVANAGESSDDRYVNLQSVPLTERSLHQQAPPAAVQCPCPRLRHVLVDQRAAPVPDHIGEYTSYRPLVPTSRQRTSPVLRRPHLTGERERHPRRRAHVHAGVRRRPPHVRVLPARRRRVPVPLPQQ